MEILMQRIFIALKITADEELNRVYNELKRKLTTDKIKWVPMQNLHLTLKFLGEIPEETVQKMLLQLQPQIASSEIRLEFSGIGIFGSRYHPKVIWLGLSPNQDLLELQQQLENQLQQLGFEPDRQNFVPHITLARINQLNDKNYFNEIIADYKQINCQPQTTDGYYVVESKLLPKGPEYSYLKKFSFAPIKK
jgi:2'-5' RNA ligase